MIAQHFPEANHTFNPPPDLDESQCQSVPVHVGEIETGNLEGARIMVMCYKPTDDEVMDIAEGKPIYLTILGPNLPPHMLSTSFFQATHPN